MNRVYFATIFFLSIFAHQALACTSTSACSISEQYNELGASEPPIMFCGIPYMQWDARCAPWDDCYPYWDPYCRYAPYPWCPPPPSPHP